MDHFENDGLELAFVDEGDRDGSVVLLLHGFASSTEVNWIEPGWFETLTKAGHRVVAFDHRGHGHSDKPHNEAVYTPGRMVGDALALLDHLSIDRAAVFGYSMGARVGAFMALEAPDRCSRLVFGGLGMGLIDGVGDWDPIAAALMAPTIDDVPDERGRMFRAFAERTRSDREALAACIATSREELTRGDMAKIAQPVLVAVGTRDDIAGSGEELAELLANGRHFPIEGRDHMLSVGDRRFKAAVVDFLEP